ncbi:MAG: ribonuclease III domain-containing protein [Euryarchaeota archaeon]|nr:ribonuclease III domain-containing protein [Euryarchaeota archaeon]
MFRTLGDAVLKAVLVDLLVKSGCKTRGEITRKKKRLESKNTLAEIGQNLGIERSIIFGCWGRKIGRKQRAICYCRSAEINSYSPAGENQSLEERLATTWVVCVVWSVADVSAGTWGQVSGAT